MWLLPLFFVFKYVRGRRSKGHLYKEGLHKTHTKQKQRKTLPIFSFPTQTHRLPSYRLACKCIIFFLLIFFFCCIQCTVVKSRGSCSHWDKYFASVKFSADVWNKKQVKRQNNGNSVKHEMTMNITTSSYVDRCALT